MNKKTVRDIDLADKTVLVRVDYNVPVQDGKVGDILRLQASLPTLQYLHEQNCRQVLISHLGRPEGKPDPKLSLEPVAAKLSELMKHEIRFLGDCVGSEVEAAVKGLPEHGMILLENLRFHPEEEANDDQFAQKLAKLAEVFVQDGFAVVHRAHASTEAVTKYLPSVAGLLLEEEVDTLTGALERPQHPLLAVVGGAKVSSKIDVLQNLLDKVDKLFIAGAMANTFLAAQRHQIGKSIYEPNQGSVTEKILASAQSKGIEVTLPTDVVVSKAKDGTQETKVVDVSQVEPDDYIVDLGPNSIEAAMDPQPASVIWNGPLGITEVPAFTNGSKLLAEAIIKSGVKSIIGGGDTAAFVDAAGLHDQFTFVSTGGGASLELMAGKKLPGVEALLDK